MDAVLDRLVLLAFIGSWAQTDIEVDWFLDIKEGFELFHIEIQKRPNMRLIKETLPGSLERLLDIKINQTWLDPITGSLFYESHGLVVLDEEVIVKHVKIRIVFLRRD
jgi:hypothetical protein